MLSSTEASMKYFDSVKNVLGVAEVRKTRTRDITGRQQNKTISGKKVNSIFFSYTPKNHKGLTKEAIKTNMIKAKNTKYGLEISGIQPLSGQKAELSFKRYKSPSSAPDDKTSAQTTVIPKAKLFSSKLEMIKKLFRNKDETGSPMAASTKNE